jgi:hypothetical protein
MRVSTRYPVFKAVKKPDWVSTAEVFKEEFNSLGHSRVIINDTGANVSSEILKVSWLYRTCIHQITIHRPEANSVFVQAHKTVKGIFRK